MTYGTFAEWRFEVDRQFRLRTKKSCEELHCKKAQLDAGYSRGVAPPEFVVGWIQQHGLVDYTKNAKY